MGQGIEMGEFLAALCHLLPDCGPLRLGLCGITPFDRSLCFSPTSPDFAAISYGPVVGGRPTGGRALRPSAWPGGRRRCHEWHCRSIRNDHPADLTAQQEHTHGDWPVDFGRYGADAWR